MAVAQTDTRTLPHRYTKEFCDEVNKLIDIGLAGAPESAWLDIKELLLKNNFARYEDNVCADDLLVDECNRGTLGLNPSDFHRNGAKIMKTGCNPAKLHDATSIELAPYGPHRDFQIQFNTKIAEASDGMMAVPTGKERLSTLGCGHFGCLVKSTRAGCRTPEQTLQDMQGHLSVSHLGKIDKRYGALCNNGYRHLVLPYDLRVAFPRLPHLVQLGLNASNEVPTKSTEMETAESLKEYMLNSKGDVKSAIAAVECTSARKGYVDKLATMVQLYVGGGNGTVIKRM